MPPPAPKFQLTAARRRLVYNVLGGAGGGVSTHSRPKAAGYRDLPLLIERLVSTHSRPKAAGQKIAGLNRTSKFQLTAARRRLGPILFMWVVLRCFNSQPPEGGWPSSQPSAHSFRVSTHSRPKAAGCRYGRHAAIRGRFQLTAARRRLDKRPRAPARRRGFNSQPPEGGWPVRTTRRNPWEGFNSQPPEGGWQRARAIR